MANVVGKTEWQVTFTVVELRLVLKALGGRLKPEDVEDAKSLGDHVAKLRASFSKSHLESVDKLLKNIE